MAHKIKTGIIATVGPACEKYSTIRAMTLCGLDVARLNFSHGKTADHERRALTIREINRKYRRAVKILVDLEGPRIRIGRLRWAKQLEISRGSTVILTNTAKIAMNWPVDSAGNNTRRSRAAKRPPAAIPMDYAGKLDAIQPGQDVFIDDGNIRLRVKKSLHGALEAEVIVGGTLKERKGVNMPGARLDFGAISAKDIDDTKWAVGHGADFIAQSFVTCGDDIERVKKAAKEASALFSSSAKRGDGRAAVATLPKIIAKIEDRDGVRNLDDIIAAADGIMIARGDLGISVPLWEVPFLQKRILRECRKKSKFSIVATQMLESMTFSPTPTRAEVSDVANAILDGADYVMLSGETAVGKYPVRAVDTMNRIIKYSETARDNL